MIGALAKDTPGEICQEILNNEADVAGLVAFAFTTAGELVWGMTASLRRMAEKLRDLARRVEVNLPSHHDPEAFHAEKSQIAYDIRQIARSLE